MAGPSGAPSGLDRINNFEHVSDLGAGNFGVARLMRDRSTGELIAVKFIERGDKIDRNVEREIMNHCTLNHPNIVGFREVFLTRTHLAIVMEYAAGGELFDRIVKAGRFSEDEARYFFQQLISGVDYLHRSGVCHRDLKLENTLLDANPAPRLKICDFGYSKSALDSQPKSTVGTPAYIAPEVLQRKQYSGQAADVWSCGVTLYVMLVGAYPFEDPQDPRNFRKTIQRIMAVQYQVPPAILISDACRDLVARIFVAHPQQRITMDQIRQHPWFKCNLPAELADPNNYVRNAEPHQSQDEIRTLIHMARTPHVAATPAREDFEQEMVMGDELGQEPAVAPGMLPGQRRVGAAQHLVAVQQMHQGHAIVQSAPQQPGYPMQYAVLPPQGLTGVVGPHMQLHMVQQQQQPGIIAQAAAYPQHAHFQQHPGFQQHPAQQFMVQPHAMYMQMQQQPQQQQQQPGAGGQLHEARHHQQ